jgi:hypothetical protein
MKTLLAMAALTFVAGVSLAQSPLRLQAGVATNAWIVSHHGQPLLRYVFNPRQYKPYVAEFSAPGGRNLLRDAPSDHLHHHALMYAIKVNGLNFWEEVSGNGVERVVETSASVTDRAATLRQTIHWVAPQDAFLADTTPAALLVEQRTLVVTVDQEQDEAALRWTSQFEVGGKTNTVALEGATYFGLGVRFQQELDPIAEHFNSDGKPDLSDTKQDVTPHDWCAVAFDRPGAPATFAMFGHPANPRGQATWFTMKRPFAYVSATQALDKEPLVYHAGDKFQVDYLVTVYPALKSAEFLNARAAEWQKRKP